MTLEQLLARNNLELRITFDEESHWTEKRTVIDREYHIAIQNKDHQMMYLKPTGNMASRYSKKRLEISITVKEQRADVWDILHAKLIERINEAVPLIATFPTRRQDTPIEIRINKPLDLVFPEKPESFNL